MMSQKRLEAKDRLRSQSDYRVNLKAELEIRQLHGRGKFTRGFGGERGPEQCKGGNCWPVLGIR
jgi:hypothetical protein